MIRDCLEAEVLEIMKTYSLACEVSCRLLKASGELVGKYPAETDLCPLAKVLGCEPAQCRRADLNGGRQAEKLGQEYIYFCPCGFVNWAVAIKGCESGRYFLIGGPILIYPVDAPAEIPVVDTTRVRHLARALSGLAQGLSGRMRKHYALLQNGPAQMHTLRQRSQGRAADDSELQDHLAARIKAGDQHGALTVLDKMIGMIYCDDAQFEIKKSRFIELAVIMAQAAIEAGADLEIVYHLEHTYLASMDECGEITAITELMVRLLDRLLECAFSFNNVRNRDLMFKAVNYIRSQLGTNVCLDDVAKEVGLNPAYFSKLFKEEMDITFTDYLNKVRIEAAKVLLIRGMPLAEISQAVGYNDQSYFSKVFKKYTGLSPRRWKLQFDKTFPGNWVKYQVN